MRFIAFTTILATLCTLKVAAQGVKVSSPAAGSSFAAGSVTITIADSGEAPALSALSSGTVDLIWGGNTFGTNTGSITGLGTFAYPATTLTVSINPGAGPVITNGYYFRITSVAADGGTSVINYSGRFTITGMTGAANAALTSAAQAAAGQVPAVQVNEAAAAATTAAGGAMFNVPYSLQSGLTKYAPMQPVPPTRITKQNPTPLNPTSAFSIATTFLGRPSVQTTITQQQTFSVSSVENQAAAQSNPQGDMQRFLNRWKD